MDIRLLKLRTFALATSLLAALVWCVQFTARASPGPLRLDVEALSPLGVFDADPPIRDRHEWAARRAPLLRQAFLSRIYGELPRHRAPQIYARRVIDAAAFNGAAQLDLVTVQLNSARAPFPLDVALVTPIGDGQFPLIVVSDFCGLDLDIDPRLPAPGWRPPRCRSALGRALTRLSHGDAILAPPVRTMIARGYAVAIFFPGDAAPDDAVLFREAQVNRLGGEEDSGAVAAWAWLYLSAFDALQDDPRLDPARVVLWGHSRYGKAALLAGALDERVGAIIANQSGTFGATLSQATRGESAAEIVRHFPHWFPSSLTSPSGAGEARSLDQHLLLALLAPRPVLLGNAGLDRWSDPAAAFAAARAASSVYNLFGSEGLAQSRMREPDLAADVAFYLRPGGHGVRSSDWAAALDFLDQHFQPHGAP